MSGAFDIDTLLSHNRDYAAGHQALPTIPEMRSLGVTPQTFLVTCVDPRCVPETFLNYTPMDGIITVRNAGGNLEAALPELLALDTMAQFKNIMVIKHTDCGTLVFKDDEVKASLAEKVPSAKGEIEKMVFGSLNGKTLEEGLKEQVAAVKGSQLVRPEIKSSIRGFIFDIANGGLTEVDV